MAKVAWLDWVLNGVDLDVKHDLIRARKHRSELERTLLRLRNLEVEARTRLKTEYEKAFIRQTKLDLEQTPVESIGLNKSKTDILRSHGVINASRLASLSDRLETFNGIGPKTAKDASIRLQRVEAQIASDFRVPGPHEINVAYHPVIAAAFTVIESRQLPKNLPARLSAQLKQIAGPISKIDEATNLFGRFFSAAAGQQKVEKYHKELLVALGELDASRSLSVAQQELGRVTATSNFDVLKKHYEENYSDYSAEFSLIRDAAISRDPKIYHVPASSPKQKPLPTRLGDPFSSDRPAVTGGRQYATASSNRTVPTASLGSRESLPDAIAQRIELVKLDNAGLRATLRGYQDFGAKFIVEQNRTILGDEMGLGKTMQALAAMVHLRNSSQVQHFLVVAPASTLGNWSLEIKKRTNLDLRLLHGKYQIEALRTWLTTGGVAVTSFQTLKTLMSSISTQQIGFIVVDEAHFIKNPAAVRTKNVTVLANKCPRLCLMTGTPLENVATEFGQLISLCDTTISNHLNGTAHAKTFDAYPRTGFAERIAPVYLRRSRKDVLHELPEKIEVDHWIDLTEGEYDQHDEALKESLLAARMKTGGSASKLAKVKELLDDCRREGVKVVAFSEYLSCLDGLQELGAENRFRLDGSIPVSRRQLLIDEFSKVDGFALMCCQITVGGTGLNLQAASVVILMEPAFKPTVEWQAIGRVQRMGQTRNVVVHRILAGGTIDEDIQDLLSRKSLTFEDYAEPSATKSASAAATDAGVTDEKRLQELCRQRREERRKTAAAKTTERSSRKATAVQIRGWWLDAPVVLAEPIKSPLGTRVQWLEVVVDISVKETVDAYTIEDVQLSKGSPFGPGDEEAVNVGCKRTGEVWQMKDTRSIPKQELINAVRQDTRKRDSKLNERILRSLLNAD